MRKADDGTNLDVGAGEGFARRRDTVGLDACRRDVVFFCNLEPSVYLGVGHGRVEEGVVDVFGDLAEGNGDGCHC